MSDWKPATTPPNKRVFALTYTECEPEADRYHIAQYEPKLSAWVIRGGYRVYPSWWRVLPGRQAKDSNGK